MMVFLVLFKDMFYFWPFYRAFWGLLFIFSRVLKQSFVLVSMVAHVQEVLCLGGIYCTMCNYTLHALFGTQQTGDSLPSRSGLLGI